MAAVLLIPFLSLRFGVLSMLDSSALRAGRPLPPVPRARKACLLALSALQRRPAAGPLLRVGPYCARPPLLERSGPLRIRPAPSPALRHRLRGPLGERRAPQGCLPHLPQSHVCFLFFRLSRLRPPHAVATASGRPPRLSAHRPHRHPGRGALVPPDLRRGLRALLRLGQTLPINNRGGGQDVRRLCYFLSARFWLAYLAEILPGLEGGHQLRSLLSRGSLRQCILLGLGKLLLQALLLGLEPLLRRRHSSRIHQRHPAGPPASSDSPTAWPGHGCGSPG